MEVTLLSSLLAGLVNQASAYTIAGNVPGLMGNAHPSIAPYEVLAASGRPSSSRSATTRSSLALAAVLGLSETAGDPRFATNAARVAHRAELTALIEADCGRTPRTRGRSASPPQGSRAGRSTTSPRGSRWPNASGSSRSSRSPTRVEPPPQRQVAHAVTLSATPAAYRTAPPDIDEDRAAVLELIGWDRS